jgi:multimeric flavodoxin WrbA
MNCYEWDIERYQKYSYELNDCVNNNLCIPEGFHEYGMPIEMFHMDMERLGIKKANRFHNVISFENRKRTDQENKEENVEIKSLKESKKVLILSASPRKKGNSQILCDKFAGGAKSAGHQVKMIRLSDKKINFCKACDACMKNEGLCIQRDDMGDILKAYQQADILVLATPVYFYGISAQMKTFIDRTYPIWQNLGHKNVYYIISAGLGEDIINRSLGDLDGFVEHLDDSKVKGRIYATNVMDAGLVKEQEDLLERAYEMGKSIFNVSANL